jgi:hypothetical protein
MLYVHFSETHSLAQPCNSQGLPYKRKAVVHGDLQAAAAAATTTTAAADTEYNHVESSCSCTGLKLGVI